MKPTLEDVIITFIDWASDKSRHDVMKLITALIYHHYKKKEIYESHDVISDDQGCVAITVELKSPKPKLTLIKNDKENK